MGTSTGYKAPTAPQWQAVKRLVSQTAAAGPLSVTDAARVVAGFLAANGGARGMARGGSALGGGRSAQRVAAGLATFLGQVARDGLPAALESVGLAALVGRPVGEILDALVDALGGAGETLEDVDARNALSRLREERLADTATADEVESILAEVADGTALAGVLVDFFTFFFFEQFCRVFYERLVSKVGDAAAAAYLDGILDYLRSVLRERQQTRDLRDVDWAGTEGRALTDELLEQTLFVYGGA
jgi:hypothetical protein